jgi:uncharacterized protein
MRDALLAPPPWFLAGPALGLVVVALLATTNRRLAVLGGYGEVVDRVRGRSGSLGWQAWFLFGIVGGGTLFASVSGGWRAGEGYGWLTRTFEADAAVAVVLLGAGTLIGYGAKLAGGCTSGNGLTGCALGSPASMVATVTFMATAIATAFLTRALVGF